MCALWEEGLHKTSRILGVQIQQQVSEELFLLVELHAGFAERLPGQGNSNESHSSGSNPDMEKGS